MAVERDFVFALDIDDKKMYELAPATKLRQVDTPKYSTYGKPEIPIKIPIINCGFENKAQGESSSSIAKIDFSVLVPNKT